MAINYLNSVDLNKNYINNAAIQNLATEPTPDTPGQVYFNTTSQALKVTVQTGTSPDTFAWEEVGSDSVVAGTGIVITPGTGAEAGNSVITNSGLINLGIVAGSQNWPITQSANTTLSFFSASANEIEVDSPTPGVVRIGLPSDVTISNNLTVANNLSVTVDAAITGNLQVDGEIVQTSSGGENQFASALNMGNNEIVDLADPTSPQEAATKAYVDAATVGGLIYQGGYNAATNTPDLDSSPSSSIKKGWTYTVTADGTFFTEQVRVGDVLIAESDAPTTLANWTTVQNNIDLASAAQVGIGNVVSSTATELAGIDVSYANPTTGTATVGLDIDGLTGNAAVDDPASEYEIPMYSAPDGENYKITVAELALASNSVTSATGTITAGNLSGTVTHAFGINTIVQTINASGDTVFCDVTRTATTSVATISVAEATDITILVQKIG
jgi:hypothetical protein